MGKLLFFIAIIIFVDLLFLTTGQLCATGECSLSSIIFASILQPANILNGQLFNELIGSVISKFSSLTGFLSLAATGGVLIGAFLATKEFRILLIPLALTMALIAGDLVFIFAMLNSINPVFGAFVSVPLGVMYIFVVVEWWRGKD